MTEPTTHLDPERLSPVGADQPDGSPRGERAILREARRIERDAEAWARAQAHARTDHGRWGALIGIAAVVSASAASVTGFGNADGAVVGIFAAAAAALSAIQGFWQPEKRTGEHHQAAASYRRLAADARLFHDDEFQRLGEAERRERLLQLLDALVDHERTWPWVSHSPLYVRGWPFRRTSTQVAGAAADAPRSDARRSKDATSFATRREESGQG